MHTVVETYVYLRAADQAGMTQAERERIVTTVATDPTAGVEIVGAGGCRKVRIAGRGKGKSGGYRVITFFSGPNVPVFLLTVFSKGERSDLSQAERNGLARIARTILEDMRGQIARRRK